MSDSKYIVCPECDGEGYHSRLGAFTGSDVDEWYGDDVHAREDFVKDYMTRGGVYDEKCECCNAERVATQQQIDAYRKRLEDEYDPEGAAEAAHFGSLGY
jgi:hypothetical protein